MGIRGRRAHDVKRGNAMGGKRIRNQTAMAAPRNRFGAHNDWRSLVRERDEAPNGRIKLGSLHMVRVAPEGIVFPCAVDRVRTGMTQAA